MTGEIIATLAGHTGTLTSLDLSRDGAMLVGSTANSMVEGTVVVWNMATGEIVATFGHPAWVAEVAFNSDETVVATACHDGKLRLWDVATGEVLAVLEHASAVTSLAFDTEGRTLASGGRDGIVRLWGVRG